VYSVNMLFLIIIIGEDLYLPLIISYILAKYKLQSLIG
jgi:hypothetical protein